MLEVTFTDMIAIFVGVSGWFAAYFQWRSVRVAESQLQTQVNSLQDVVGRIEAERQERARAIKEEASERLRSLTEAKSTLHDDFWETHRRSWELNSSARVVYGKFIAELSLCLSLLSNTPLVADISLDTDQQERLEIISRLAGAIAQLSDLQADFTYAFYENDQAVKENRQHESPEAIRARYDIQFEKAHRERHLALEHLMQFLAKLKERASDEA